MPTYDYQCDGCEHKFEQWQSFHDDALTKCPACKKKKLRRLFGGGAAILFKGSGFYETDYNRSESYKSSEKAEKESGTKPEAKSESSSDTKSDAKADAKPAPAPPPAKDAKGGGKAKKET
jgi:putative FmdB family regulatory protein